MKCLYDEIVLPLALAIVLLGISEIWTILLVHCCRVPLQLAAYGGRLVYRVPYDAEGGDTAITPPIHPDVILQVCPQLFRQATCATDNSLTS